ncbi:MAG: hypothetical protein PG978_000327 [Wolbachia endosymbiont of Ctenocephalides felis wCfeF]|nr:MAG: hypothetical protein PG978_000327 [Wolbachia endosymbiont of Ctenocephalides felis wCfeF]
MYSPRDRDGALNLFTQAKQKAPTLCKFFVGQGYTGKLQNCCLLTIARKLVDTGFKVNVGLLKERLLGFPILGA